jgi:glycosyltransferase involved in cell wall biosynthesis
VSTERLLIITHGDASQVIDRAQLAARELFHEYRRRGLEAVLVSHCDTPPHAHAAFSAPSNERELSFYSPKATGLTFEAAEPDRITGDFRELLLRFRPTVVHFHDYEHIGLECVHEVRSTLPSARIALTLHDYRAICAHDGRMVRRHDSELCTKASPAECVRCFPHYGVPDFFLRERYVKTLLSDVDVLIATSEFLAERHRQWGLPAEKINLIPNGYPERNPPPPRTGQGGLRTRFAYFGEIAPHEGLDILLEAVTMLPDHLRLQSQFDVHGTVLSEQPTHFVERVSELGAACGDSVIFRGPYNEAGLHDHMARTDWVVVPAVWWESSPRVIWDAFAHGRPVICSDIGAMAELVRHRESGLLFRARSARHLAEALAEAMVDTSLWSTIVDQLPRPLSISESADAHLLAYSGRQSEHPRPRAATTLGTKPTSRRKLARRSNDFREP